MIVLKRTTRPANIRPAIGGIKCVQHIIVLDPCTRIIIQAFDLYIVFIAVKVKQLVKGAIVCTAG